MFSHKMSESLEGVVRLDDISLAVLRQVLRFLYTGTCDLGGGYGESKSEYKERKDKSQPHDMAAQLFAAADRFQIADLQLFCAAKLSENVSADNAAELLLLADAYHAPLLKKRVLEFMRASSQRLTDVMDTDAFQKLSPALLHELLAQFGSPGKKRPREESALSLVKGDVKKLKVSELRAELESRGLESGGLKSELLERLENAIAS